MTEETMKLMDATLALARDLVIDPASKWHVRNATELNIADYQNVVEYSKENVEMKLVMVSGAVRKQGKFASGVVTTKGGEAPVVLNLPPDFLDWALKEAMRKIASNN